jgi:hypothetical protein
MRSATRKAILFTILTGIVGYLVVDSGDGPRAPQRDSSAAKGAAGGGAGESRASARGERYALPERAALGAPHAALFGAKSWQAQLATGAGAGAAQASPAPKVPPMPYRYAGKSVHEGQTKVYLAKGERVFPIRTGDTLDGAYRVQEIESTRITLLYLPLGRKETIPVKSSLTPIAHALDADSGAARMVEGRRAAGARGKAARVQLDGPRRVKLGAPFTVAMHVTSEQPVASSPVEFKFDPKLLETVAVKPGRFFAQGKDQFNVRVSPHGSIIVGARNDARLPAPDAEFLLLTFRPIRPAAVAELSVASLSLRGPAGRAIAFDTPAAFRTAITP